MPFTLSQSYVTTCVSKSIRLCPFRVEALRELMHLYLPTCNLVYLPCEQGQVSLLEDERSSRKGHHI